MRRIFVVCAALVAGGSAALAAAPAAAADKGTVTVFSTEFQRLSVWKDPDGCKKLPIAAHILFNQTTGDVRLHADPLCLTPGLTVKPGYGAHTMPGTGSFSA